MDFLLIVRKLLFEYCARRMEDTYPVTRTIESYVVAGALGSVDIRINAAARLVDTNLTRQKLDVN